MSPAERVHGSRPGMKLNGAASFLLSVFRIWFLVLSSLYFVLRAWFFLIYRLQIPRTKYQEQSTKYQEQPSSARYFNPI
jgi:hypothetical protein